jgi:hypothetical protein
MWDQPPPPSDSASEQLQQLILAEHRYPKAFGFDEL